MREKFTNNFYGYFPVIRERNKVGPESEKAEKIIADLDKVLEEYNFDVEALTNAVDNWTQLFQKQRSLYQQGKWEDGDKLGPEINKYVEQVEELTHPIYLEMLGIGYKKADLIKRH